MSLKDFWHNAIKYRLAGGHAADHAAMGVDPIPIPSFLRRQSMLNSWVWKHPSTTQALAGSWWLYVPVGGGYYAAMALGTWNIATAVPHLGKLYLGVIGAYTHHSAGAGVTKTGSWGLSNLDYAPAGSVCYSTTAGDQISFSVSGHTLIMRSICTVNGGYAIVAVDGDFINGANRLPVFTAADLAAGRCRAGDVGKRYINAGANAAQPDWHVPIAEGLTDGAHTVTFEATGTYPSYSSAARCYIGGIVAASAANATQSLSANTYVIGLVEAAMESASACVYVPEVEKAAGGGVYEFLGEVHGYETSESLIIETDGTDQSSLAAGSYASATVLSVRSQSTIANSDATGTPVARKRIRIAASAYSEIPFTVSWNVAWLAARRVRSSYPLMLPLGKINQATNGVIGGRWDKAVIGPSILDSTAFSSNNNSTHGNAIATLAYVGSAAHPRVAFAALLDGGASVNWWASSYPDRVFLSDRSDGMDKIYFCRSTQPSRESYAIGDTYGGVVGFGIIP